MIKIAKKQLYKIFIFFLFIFYLFLSLLFLSRFKINPFSLLSILFLPNILVIFYLLKRYYKKKLSLSLEIQKLQENINLLLPELNRMTSVALSLKQRIENYKSLKSLMEKLNQQWDLNKLAQVLLDTLFKLIAKRRGNSILYLVDPHTQKLSIFTTLKEIPEITIRAKEGDLFDLWVIKHTASLLVENAKNDFRFDYVTIEKEAGRTITSLISSPLFCHERLLGIIRLDSPFDSLYSQEDLRLLETISHFTAIAIENTRLLQEVKELAIKDSLTGCFTKGYFMERIKEEFLKNIKEGLPLSLLMLDIDHFKKYNDRFGHIAGDIVLRELGRLLNELIGDKGIVFRFGGEEFCIILPNINKKEGLKIAERILRAVEKKEIFLRRHRTSITVSIGLASAPEDTVLEDEIIFKADQSLYQAKQKGRNRVCYI